MTFKILFGYVLPFLCCSCTKRASATILSTTKEAEQVLRISTKNFPPFMYQDINGNYYNGMEFRSLQMVASVLNVSLHFRTPSRPDADTCHDVAINVSDICIGGLFPKKDIFDYAVMSVTYDMDHLTWCVRKADLMPRFLSFLGFMQPGSWLLVVFCYGYGNGFLLFMLIQFDREYEQRNNRDWHFTTWLVLLPAAIGMSPNFRPVRWTTRTFFAFVLITAFFYFQIIFTQFHGFVHSRISWHQISSLKELMENDFDLAGSMNALNLLDKSEEISNQKTESFLDCELISECFVQLMQRHNLAVCGSRQNILNSPFISHSKIFCFKDLENIASYPISLYMRKDWHFKGKINQILERLFETGFFVKWKKDLSRLELKHETKSSVPLQLTIAHIGAPLVFLIGCGSLISISTFVAENIVSWKIKQKESWKIWVYLEHFLDGERHYLRDLPKRLEMENRITRMNFPYLE